MLILGHDQQSDTGGNKHGDVEDGVGLGQVVKPSGRQGVDAGMDYDEGSHGADDMPRQRDVAVRPGLRVIRAESDGGQKHLSGAILGGGAAGDLTDEVEPT